MMTVLPVASMHLIPVVLQGVVVHCVRLVSLNGDSGIRETGIC